MQSGFVRPWTALAWALLAHVIDEALTGFLVVYNPTVMALRDRYPWLLLPVFQFEYWLGGLLLGVIVLFLLRPFARRAPAWFRWVAAAFAVLMVINGVGHVAGTIAGRTLATLPFQRPMPGFWSSPLLMAASLWVLWRLRALRYHSGRA